MVVRYMDKEYVERFFEFGELRLTSFPVFRNYSDEPRRDVNEGVASQNIEGRNGSLAMIAFEGRASYVLSTSTLEDEKLQKEFNVNSGFRILDSFGFATSIASHIPGFCEGWEGICSYRSAVSLRKRENIEYLRPPDKDGDHQAYVDSMNALVARHAVDSFFVKHLRYGSQCEYRFIWNALSEPKDYLTVQCPECRHFCESLPPTDEEFVSSSKAESKRGTDVEQGKY
jgi:hypothetical protein